MKNILKEICKTRSFYLNCNRLLKSRPMRTTVILMLIIAGCLPTGAAKVEVSPDGSEKVIVRRSDKIHLMTKGSVFDYHGSYLGHKNPVNAADESISSYAIPPTDYQDFAAFLHDKDYDKVGAAGLGGVMSEKTLEADKRLVANLKKYQHLAKSPSAKKWGARATLFFTTTSAEKQVYQQLRLTAIIFTSSLLKHL